MSTYLIQDPHHPYASRFIQVMRERYGLRPVAVRTVSDTARHSRRDACLPASEFAASYVVADGDVEGFAAHLRQAHPDLIAVIPYSEETLELAAALQARLPLRWNDSATISRFRHKAAMRSHLRRVAPSVRLNFHCPVGSAADVQALGADLPGRFVLKPNSGFASRGVAVFRAEQVRAVRAFFQENPGLYLLEQFIEGPLYAVDGLVDAEGRCLVASIFSSGRQFLNGTPVVSANGTLVHEDTPLFAELAGYATAVVVATGLRRSPFHVEVARDALGPCLIEVGARLVGHSHAFTCDRVHGGALDFFGRAAAGYLGAPVDTRLSFSHYNRVQAAQVCGASELEGTAYRVRGVKEVEALPSFDRWIVKPAPGMALARTTDRFTLPYSLVLTGPRDGEDLAEVGAQVHRTLQLDTTAPALHRVRIQGALLAGKMWNRLAWVGTAGRARGAPARLGTPD